MIAKSIHGRSDDEINALHQAMADGYTPTLAIIFISIKQDRQTLCEMLHSKGIDEIWKATMAGFFTYGEYGRALKGKQEFHSTTCCWVALKEK